MNVVVYFLSMLWCCYAASARLDYGQTIPWKWKYSRQRALLHLQNCSPTVGDVAGLSKLAFDFFFDSSFLRILTWIVFDQVTGNNSSTLPSCSLPRAACHVFGCLLNLRPSPFCSGYNNTAKRITHRGVEVRPIQPPLLSLNLSSWPTPIRPSQNKFLLNIPLQQVFSLQKRILLCIGYSFIVQKLCISQI